MPVRIRINYTTSTGEHTTIVDDATPHNDGVMTAAQAAKLAGLTPGGGFGVVIFWRSDQTWSDIVAKIPDPSTGQGAIIELMDVANYHLTAGSFDLDNVIFMGSGTNSTNSTLTADAGFNLNASTVGNFFLRNVNFVGNGTILDTASGGGGGGFNLIAENSDLSFWLDAFILDVDSEASITLVNSSLTGRLGAHPFRVRNGGTLDITLSNSFVGHNIFTGGAGSTLNIFYDPPSIIFTSYQTGFTVVGGGFDSNEITVPSAGGVVNIATSPGNGSDGTATTVFFQAAGNDSNVTAINLLTSGSDVVDGQRLTLLLKQASAEAGIPTWPATIGNALMPGGTLSKTTTSSALDAYEFVFSKVAGNKWVCVSRSLDVK